MKKSLRYIAPLLLSCAAVFTIVAIERSKSWQIEAVQGELITLNQRWESRSDSSVVALVEGYETAMQQEVNRVLGFASGAIDREYPIYPLVALGSDMLLAKANEVESEPVDMGILNTGGVRASFDAGDITWGEIISAFPFENRLVVVTLKGSDLTDLMATQYVSSVMVSKGTHVTYNKEREMTTFTLNNRPIEADKLYRIATIDYLANGNNGLELMSRAVARTDHPLLVREVVKAYIEQHKGAIAAPTHTRMVRPRD